MRNSGPPPSGDPYPVNLSAADRQRANHVYDSFIAGGCRLRSFARGQPIRFEVRQRQAGVDKFLQEERGTRCFAVRQNATSATVMAVPEKSHCLPTSPPAISACPEIPLQYYVEASPDKRGYRANPAGSSFVDTGVGLFLRTLQVTAAS